MSTSIEITVKIVADTCAECGVVFGLEAGYQRQRRDDHQSFYCPNGHSLSYAGKSEAERLKEDLKRRDSALAWERDRRQGEQRRADHAERRLSATKGVVTKMRKRVGAGVCPCCNRHFTALERHMATKHPAFREEPA